MKRNQTGLTLMSFIVVLAVVGFFAYVGMKLFPMYQQYFQVRDAVKGLANEANSTDMDEDQVRVELGKRFDIGYVEDIKNDQIKISHGDSGGLVVDIAWEERRPLVYNLDIVGKFEVKQQLGHSTY